MSACNHSEAEQDTELVDGACPICMGQELEKLRARIAELEKQIADNEEMLQEERE